MSLTVTSQSADEILAYISRKAPLIFSEASSDYREVIGRRSYGCRLEWRLLPHAQSRDSSGPMCRRDFIAKVTVIFPDPDVFSGLKEGDQLQVRVIRTNGLIWAASCRVLSVDLGKGRALTGVTDDDLQCFYKGLNYFNQCANACHVGRTLAPDIRGWLERSPLAQASSHCDVYDGDGSLGMIPCDSVSGACVNQVWNSVTYTRHLESLLNIRRLPDIIVKVITARSLAVADISDGQPRPDQTAMARLQDMNGDLNRSQRRAVMLAIQSRFLLVQGPPGTGKTKVASRIASALLSVYSRFTSRGPMILCVAPSNTAADNIALAMSNARLNVVRVYSMTRERNGDDGIAQAKPLTLRNKVEECARRIPGWDGLREGDKWNHYKMAERTILARCDVIVSTCVGSVDKRILGAFSSSPLKILMVDEAGQAQEPDVTTAMTFGPDKVILLGDHRQLPPLALSDEARQGGLDCSMFERLISGGVVPSVLLDIQYRMHPVIAEWPSQFVYEGRIRTGIQAGDRSLPGGGAFPWPVPGSPTLFHDARGREIPGRSGRSLLNKEEGRVVLEYVSALISCGVSANDVGVITPYQGQREHLTARLSRRGFQAVEVGTVDSFQGREKEVIIFSCVRSSARGGIGFLDSQPRLNVALTRARSGLIIVGNSTFLSQDRMWKSLIQSYRRRGLFARGGVVTAPVSPVASRVPTPPRVRPASSSPPGPRTSRPTVSQQIRAPAPPPPPQPPRAAVGNSFCSVV